MYTVVDLSESLIEQVVSNILGFDVPNANPYLTSDPSPVTSWSRSPLLASGCNVNGGPESVACTATINLMAGPVPTYDNFPANFSDRSDDLLIRYTTNDLSVSYPASNRVTVAASSVTASATGECTWFWWNVRASPISTDSLTPTGGGDEVIHSIIGRVTTIDGGGDLELPDTLVLAGLSYKITGLTFAFPMHWEYGELPV